jgi:Sec-independent protein secretion pathway component TatC
MFYLKELYFRFFYFILCSSFCLLIVYLYKEQLAFILILPSYFGKSPIEYFIFTEPKEIFLFYLALCFFCYFLFSLPYFLFSCYDYIKPALYINENIIVSSLLKKMLNFYIIFNIIIFLIFLPIFWNFFSSFTKETGLILFYFELSALNYFHFLFTTFLICNLLLIFLSSGVYIFIKYGFSILLQIKPYIILLFLLFSTLITPPDLELQIILFFFLYISLEIFLFLFFVLYSYKNKLIYFYKGNQLNVNNIEKVKIK